MPKPQKVESHSSKSRETKRGQSEFVAPPLRIYKSREFISKKEIPITLCIGLELCVGGGVISEKYMTPSGGKSSIGAVTNNKGGKMGKKDGEVSPYEQGIVLLVVLIAITLIMVWLAQ